MTSLAFEVLDARPERYAAEPTLLLAVRVTEMSGAAVHAVALRCQIRIEPQRRRYEPAEEERLVELFGETPQWGDSLRPFTWQHVSTVVPAFVESIVFDLPLRCSYDFEVAASKYLHSVDGGAVPLVLCFSGTAFAGGRPDARNGATSGTGANDAGFATPVSWNRDAVYSLPVRVWRETMDQYFPNSGWMRVSRATLDAVTRFKASRALPTWDHAIEQLLKEAGEER